MSKGTKISIGRFLIEYFTPLTLGEQHQGTHSDEYVTEVWLTAKSEGIRKVRRTKDVVKGAEAHCPHEKAVEKTSWFSRPDDWGINSGPTTSLRAASHCTIFCVATAQFFNGNQLSFLFSLPLQVRPSSSV